MRSFQDTLQDVSESLSQDEPLAISIKHMLIVIVLIPVILLPAAVIGLDISGYRLMLILMAVMFYPAVEAGYAAGRRAGETDRPDADQ